MSNLTLGLDLGTNSIGWALLDEPGKKIIATGVRVFPEGVDRDQQGGEKSKSQTRRTARGTRRLLMRRSRRKRKLRSVLTEAGLLPRDEAALDELLAVNPYPLRTRICREKLGPFEIGRVLLHLNQRRGFLSNRKTDRGDKETKGMLADIGELSEAIRASGASTLGEYLASLDAEFDHTATANDEKIRGRHTLRQMYIDEFEAIWQEQQRHHPEILTTTLKKLLHDPTADETWVCRGLIFGQRRVYWPKSIVGRCDLERTQRRCQRAALSAQRFRIYQEVNNLNILDRSTGEMRRLTNKEQQTLYEYLDNTKQRTFDQIRKKLGFLESVQFNFERGGRTKLKGNETNAALISSKAVGRERWTALSDSTKDAVVDILIDEEREDEALRRLRDDCDLSVDEAQGALSANLPDGHMNFSLLAIEKLLPHLKRGLFLMGNDPTDSAIHAAGYLRPDEREIKLSEYLPPPPDLPNPIVRQALIEVRKVVNGVLREEVYRKGNTLDEIRIELAREAKKSFDQRKEIRFKQLDRNREREAASEEIKKLGVKPTRPAIARYLLWKEQEEFCPYSGTKIGLAELFTSEIDVDHILPRWRSLDDSMPNKVVCRRKENTAKGDQTPHEWLAESDPEKYDRVLRLADKLPGNKPVKFRTPTIELSEFVNRQLTDTAYISRCVAQYLKSIGASLVTPRGNMTADLRHWWDMNNILDPEKRGRKMRNDHRHHAVDAIVIALTNTKRLHALANARGENMPAPWEGFFEAARQSVIGINTSHRTLKRLRGALHEATFYGSTQKQVHGSDASSRKWAEDWVEDEKMFVRRKLVTEIKNAKHLGKVRDQALREILRKHLCGQSIDPNQAGNFPTTAFKGENTPHMPSGVPIRKVRMLERSKTFRRLSDRRSFQFVKPGSNHHIVYRENGDGDNADWSAEVVPMWDAAQRAKRGLPLVDQSDRDEGRFIMSLTVGEMFEMDDQDGSRQLCVVYKMRQDDGRISYKLHTDAREATDVNKDNQNLSPRGMRDRHAVKVTVDPLGRIRWAND